MSRSDITDLDVIAPNFGRNYSGVSATIERILRVQCQTYRIVAVGGHLADDVPKIRPIDLLALSVSPGSKRPLIWHARRNNDMLVGLLLKRMTRMPLKLVFTSSSQRFHSAFSRFLIGQMDIVIATSAKSARYLSCSSIVIPHGMETQRFRPTEDRSALRRELGMPDGILVGCFGRIRHDKGIDLFVDALMDVMENRQRVYGVICGLVKPRYRQYAQAIRTRIKKRGLSDRFVWLGEVRGDRMPAMYQALDLFVAPQRAEGFGLTPLEAMACGIPVVTTRAGAFPEQVDDGRTGIIVATGSAEPITRAVAELLDEPDRLQEMGRLARQHVVEQFPLDAEVKALNCVYEALWSNRGLAG